MVKFTDLPIEVVENIFSVLVKDANRSFIKQPHYLLLICKEFHELGCKVLYGSGETNIELPAGSLYALESMLSGLDNQPIFASQPKNCTYITKLCVSIDIDTGHYAVPTAKTWTLDEVAVHYPDIAEQLAVVKKLVRACSNVTEFELKDFIGYLTPMHELLFQYLRDTPKIQTLVLVYKFSIDSMFPYLASLSHITTLKLEHASFPNYFTVTDLPPKLDSMAVSFPDSFTQNPANEMADVLSNLQRSLVNIKKLNLELQGGRYDAEDYYNLQTNEMVTLFLADINILPNLQKLAVKYEDTSEARNEENRKEALRLWTEARGRPVEDIKWEWSKQQVATWDSSDWEDYAIRGADMLY